MISSYSLLALLVPAVLASPTVNRRADASCGVRGYNLKTDAYSYSESPSKATFNGCSASCKAASKCKAFAFGQGACLLYTKTV
jgi:hypothetical protein